MTVIELTKAMFLQKRKKRRKKTSKQIKIIKIDRNRYQESYWHFKTIIKKQEQLNTSELLYLVKYL